LGRDKGLGMGNSTCTETKIGAELFKKRSINGQEEQGETKRSREQVRREKTSGERRRRWKCRVRERPTTDSRERQCCLGNTEKVGAKGRRFGSFPRKKGTRTLLGQREEI